MSSDLAELMLARLCCSSKYMFIA